MNEEIMKALGFGDAVELVKKGICPDCKKKVDLNSFRDRKSVKEFHISGLCSACQKKIFGR